MFNYTFILKWFSQEQLLLGILLFRENAPTGEIFMFLFVILSSFIDKIVVYLKKKLQPKLITFWPNLANIL